MRTYSTHRLLNHNSRAPLSSIPPPHGSLQSQQSGHVRIKYDRPRDREIVVQLNEETGELENEKAETIFRAEQVSFLKEGAAVRDSDLNQFYQNEDEEDKHSYSSSMLSGELYDTSSLIFKVLKVTAYKDAPHKTLEVSCSSSFPNKVFRVELKGHIWGETVVAIGNYVRILAPFSSEYCTSIQGPPHDENFLIVEPLLLLPPTSIVKTVSCQRKPFLEKNFMEIQDQTTSPYLKGIVVHQLFQHMLHIKLNEKRHPRPQDYNACIDRLIEANRLKIYSLLDLTEEELRKEAKQAVSQILKWIPHAVRDMKMQRVLAIEEDYSSERFGIRAKIDATIEVKGEDGTNKISALELKSGKYETFQYKGQVLFYALLIQEKYQERSSMKHWLVYILNSKNEEIKYDYNQIASLIRLRNRMAYFQRRFEENPTFENIPQCTTNKIECKKCNIYLPCATIAASLEENKNRRYPGTLEEFKHATESLTTKQKEYLAKWIRLIGWKECITTLPTKRYAATKFNFHWKEDGPFTYQSEISPGKLDPLNKVSSSAQSKAFLLQITFEKICKGVPLLSPIHEDDQVTLQANSVPTTTLRGGVVVRKEGGSDEIVIKIDRQEIKRAKQALSQGQGQFITDVFLHLYQWSIISKGASMTEGFDSSSSNREFSMLRGNLISMVSMGKDNPVLQTVIDGLNPQAQPSAFEHIENSVYLNFFEEYNEFICPAQKKLVTKIQQGEPIILLDSTTGCGLSVALAFVIKLLHSVKMSVLLTGTSIVEIDHVLETMLANMQKDWEVPFVRIGSKKIMSRGLEPYTLPEQFEKKDQIEAFLKDKHIFAANIKDCGNLIFEAAQCKEFDYVIVLGSHTLSEPKSLGAISRAKRLILAGNSCALELKKKQVTFNGREYEQSLFQRLLQADIGSQLVLPLYSSVSVSHNQFQLNEELLNFFNLAFFKMKLYHKDAPKEVTRSFFNPLPIGIDSFQAEDQKESAQSLIKYFLLSDLRLTFTERLFRLTAPAVCMVNVQPEIHEGQNAYQANQTQQVAEAKVIDEILHAIKNYDQVNLSSKIHIFSPVKSHLKMLRLMIKKGTQVSISFVDDFPLTRAKDCVILSTGISCPSTDTAFPISTLSALMRGRSKLIIVTNKTALGKVKGFNKVMNFFNERASTHIFDYKP